MNIDTKALKTALANISRIVGRRQTLPILSHVKLHTERNRLHITGSNLDEFIVERCEVGGEIDPVCVSFNRLDMSLSGESVSIAPKGKQILVKCGDDETLISTLAADEFPPLPKFEKSINHGVACVDLANAINQVAFAGSKDDARYVLNSVLIWSSAKKMTTVATNGRELAMVDLASIGSELEIIAPLPFVHNLSAALSRPGSVLASNENQIKVSHDWGNYFCKQVEGKYPDYKQVIPASTKPLGTVKVEEFLNKIESCIGYSSDHEAEGVFTFSNKELLIEFNGDEDAMLSRHLPGKFAPFKAAYSTKKLALIFKNIKTDEAELFFVDELSPLVIEAGDLTVLTMPIRLQK